MMMFTVTTTATIALIMMMFMVTTTATIALIMTMFMVTTMAVVAVVRQHGDDAVVGRSVAERRLCQQSHVYRHGSCLPGVEPVSYTHLTLPTSSYV